MPDQTVQIGIDGPRSGAKQIADAVTEAGNGLKGWGKTAANMTAVGVALMLLCGLVYFLMDQAREDRKATKEFIQQIQADHKEAIKDAKEAAIAVSRDAKELQASSSREQKERSKEIEALHTKSFDKLGERIDKATEEQRRATDALVTATKVLEKKN